jgi:DNA-binding CsgD family transcriptional regulator
MESGSLVERSAEVSVLQGALRRLLEQGQGGLVLVEAPAGVGKSRLLREAEALAIEGGARVLRARGGEQERQFAFAVVRQLLSAALAALPEEARVELVSGPGAAAAGLLDGSLPTPSLPAEQRTHAVLTALHGIALRVAAAAPTVLVVDDLHWVDEPSLRWLSFLCGRLGREPLLLVAATRPADGDPAVDPGLLAQIARDAGDLILRPTPLTAAGTARLVREAYGEAAAEFTDSCHEVTGGNPFLLRELLAGLAAEHVEPTSAGAERVGAVRPQAVASAVLRRIDSLSAAVRPVAEVVAVLGDASTIAAVAELAGLDRRTVLDAAAALGSVGVLARDGEELSFVHPIVRAAVYADLSSERRDGLHLAEAKRLHAAGAGAEAVASPLLACTPAGEAWVVERLREAARSAARHGAPDAALHFLRRALAEPPRPALRSALLLRLGAIEAGLGEPQGIQHMEAALGCAPDVAARGRAALELTRAYLVVGRIEDGRELLDSLVAELGEAETALARQLEAERASLSWFSPGARETRTTAVAASPVPTLDELMGFAFAALERALRCDPAPEAVELARRALADGRLVSQATSSPVPCLAAYVLTLAEEHAEAEAALQAIVAEGERRRSIPAVCGALGFRALLWIAQGELQRAVEDAERGLRAGDTGMLEISGAGMISALVDVGIARGELTSAAALLARNGVDGDLAENATQDVVLVARGRLRLAQGGTEAAIADFELCGERQARWGARNPAAVAWRGGLAAALLARGERGDRGRARELGAEEVELARAFGAPRAQARALMALAGTEAGKRRVELLEEAAELAGEAKVLRGQVALELGRALADRGARRPSREALRRAYRLGGADGVAAVAAAARAALDGRGASRGPGGGELTARERRVAGLARDGLTNRDIAEELGVAEKTVEVHLGNAYRKLGIRSRFQLGEALPD